VTDETPAGEQPPPRTAARAESGAAGGRPKETAAEHRMREALGPEIGSDVVAAAGEVARRPPSSRRPLLLAAIVGVIALVVVGWFVAPPFPPGGHPGDPIAFPIDAIKANFELPPPHVVVDLDPSSPPSTSLITFDLTIPASVLTGWLIMVLIIVLAVILSRAIALVPSRGQNALEYVYEGLANFATSLGGPAARRYLPIFAGLFIFILLSNWSGLVPGVGHVEFLRAPTSDLNVTIGLALFSFFLFQAEGIRRLGFRAYFGKFFSLRPFREEGVFAGVIGLYVGVIEFFLDFVRPVTLSMRLFGNIYGGEVALGVITALTIAVIPVAMVGLEALLNFMQALIFSVLTLMYTLIAIEGHDEEHAEGPHDEVEAMPKPSAVPVP
jgi:F-type H+-transporting ATPase subunit a